jgi:hypothetical protein
MSSKKVDREPQQETKKEEGIKCLVHLCRK